MLSWRATATGPAGTAFKASVCGRYWIAVCQDPLADMENMQASYVASPDVSGNIGGGIRRYPIGDRLRKEKAAQELRAACDAHALTVPQATALAIPSSRYALPPGPHG